MNKDQKILIIPCCWLVYIIIQYIMLTKNWWVGFMCVCSMMGVLGSIYEKRKY